jgi:WD40 repeat protein
MLARHFRALALLLVLTLLAGASARLDDEKEPPDDEPSDAPPGKVEPVLNTGGHTATVAEMAFDPAARKLYTAGPPGEVNEWHVETGERLRVWRFPYIANRISLSRDGKRLAVAGHSAGTGEKPYWLIDLRTGDVTAGSLEGRGKIIHRLAFDFEGKRLAFALPRRFLVQPVDGKGKALDLPREGLTQGLTFDPTGKWLASGWFFLEAKKGEKKESGVRLYDVRPGPNRGPSVILEGASGPTPCVAFSPDGKRLACINGSTEPTLKVWAVSDNPGKPKQTFDRKALRGALKKALDRPGLGLWEPIGVAFLPGGDVIAAWEQGEHLRLFRVNLDKKTLTLLSGDLRRESRTGGMAVSQNGKYVAVSVRPGYKIAVYDLEANKLLTYRDPVTKKAAESFGPSLPPPLHVGWMPEGYGIVWGYTRQLKVKWQDTMTHGINLDTMKALEKGQRAKAVSPGELPPGWKVEFDNKQRAAFLTRPKAKSKVQIQLKEVQPVLTKVFKVKDGLRLLVNYDAGRHLAIVDPDTGKPLDQVGRLYFPVLDLAVSPDGKYLLVAGGDQRLRLYDLSKPRFPLLEVAARRQEWIAWTKEGYYAGSPGGEQLIGWKVSVKGQTLASFYPAQTFRKTHYKPEVLQELLRSGSLDSALQKVKAKSGGKAEVKARSVEDALPPTVTITKAERDPKNERKWTITAVAESADGKKQPIEMLKLLIDGRPLPGELSTKRLKAGERAVTWEVPDMPPGEKVELKVLARGPDTYGVSQPREITVPAPAAQRPALHVVSVGMTYTGDKALDLGPCPKNDAAEIFKQFPASCVGKDNLFGTAPHKHLLIDKAAGKEGVKAALDQVKKDVKPRDLVVFFYAGHGVVEKNEFYLLTHGSDLNALAGTALSGKALWDELADFPCQVLVLLDACHSGESAKVLRQPATDEASRKLADEECSVTLIDAAMGHQRALQPEGGKHGFFTQAVLAALKRNKDVTHNRFNGRQYVHHLFGDVFDEVEGLTKGRQHPTISLPWTVESYPVRQVAQARKAVAP